LYDEFEKIGRKKTFDHVIKLFWVEK
jgi:hypothetical protein